MNMRVALKRWLPGALLLVSIGMNLWLAKRLLDVSIHLTYRNNECERVENVARQAMILANTRIIGEPVESVRAQFPRDVTGLPPFEKDGCLFVGGVCLRVGPGHRVVRIQE